MNLKTTTNEYPVSGHDELFVVEESSYWFSHRHQVVEWVLKRFPYRDSLLDVGGGNGYQVKRLQDTFPDVRLVEPGESGCRNAAKRGVRQICHATLQQLELPQNSVGAISLFDVVEHLDDPAELLGEVYRVLQPGGFVYITVPAYSFLWSVEDHQALHRRRYSLRKLKNFLEGQGFDVVYRSGFFRYLVWPIFFLRALPYRLSFGLLGRQKKFNPSTHAPSPTVRRVMQWLSEKELALLRKKGSFLWGASLIVVGQKRRLYG